MLRGRTSATLAESATLLTGARFAARLIERTLRQDDRPRPGGAAGRGIPWSSPPPAPIPAPPPISPCADFFRQIEPVMEIPRPVISRPVGFGFGAAALAQSLRG